MAVSDDDDNDDGGGSVTLDAAKSYAAFAYRAIRRRVPLVLGAFVVFSILVFVGLAVWPRVYHTELRLTADDTGALGPGGSEALVGADIAVLRESSLKAIVKGKTLASRWEKTRSPLHRLRDAAMARLRGAPSEQEKIAALTGSLAAAYSFNTWGPVLTIGIDWPDQDMALPLVDEGKRVFLESRREREISTLEEYIAILQRHFEKQKTEVLTLATQIQKMRKQRVEKAKERIGEARKDAAAADGARPAPVARAAAPRAAPDMVAEVERIKVAIESKQAAIDEAERDRGARVKALQAQMHDLQLQYTDVHPEVIRVRQKIDVATAEAPQLAALRRDVKDLRLQLQQMTGLDAGPSRHASGGASAAPASALASLPTEVMALMEEGIDEVDPTISQQFRSSLDKLGTLQGEMDQRVLALDRAEAAFNRRYRVIAPAIYPASPSKPNVKLVAAIGVIGGLLLGLILALLAELRSDRIVARWQVESLQLPLIAEFRLPPRQR